jgi:ribose transport system substrate-binding protein
MHVNAKIARTLQITALAVLPALLFSGCASSGNSPESNPGGQKVGFAQGNFGNGWYEVNAEGATEAMKSAGLALDVVSGGGDSVIQNTQIANFITQGYTGLIINPTGPQALSKSFEDLQSNKIPFVLVNAGVMPDLLSMSYCYVTEDEKVNAGLVGAEMARKMMATHPNAASVKLLLVLGYPGDTNSANREAGFKQGYASVVGAPSANYLENIYGKWAADTAVAPVASVATGNPDLDGMFVATDSMLPGVQQALQGVGMWGNVAIAGYDGSMKVVADMKADATYPVFATVANLPAEQGKIAAEMLQKALDGVDKETACPGNRFLVQPTLVTQKNAATYFVDVAAY